MSTMPGPFVGGGAYDLTEGGPRPIWQPPYAPGLEESELEEPAAGPEATATVRDTGSFDVIAPPSTGPDEAIGEEAIQGDEEEIDYPDYIFESEDEEAGPEAEEAAKVPEMTPEPAASGLEEPEQSSGDFRETSGVEAPEDLARTVRELMEGPLGPDLRELMIRLEGLPTSEAVARAFAAGFRTGQIQEES